MIWPGSAEAAITLSFDDGYAATCRATISSLHQRGLSGTYHTITDLVGETFDGLEIAGWADWREASGLGHEIGSHGKHHTPLAGRLSDIRRLVSNLLEVEDRRAYVGQLLAAKRALNNWREKTLTTPDLPIVRPIVKDLAYSRSRIDLEVGSPLTESFSYPAGKYDPVARRAVVEAGFRSARSLDLGLNHAPSDLFTLRAVPMVPGMRVEDLVTWVAKARQTGAWLILVFHLVAEENPSGYPYFCSFSDWQRLLDSLQAHPIWIATQRQVVRCLSMKVVDGTWTDD